MPDQPPIRQKEATCAECAKAIESQAEEREKDQRLTSLLNAYDIS
jgi:hypothetical protein